MSNYALSDPYQPRPSCVPVQSSHYLAGGGFAADAASRAGGVRRTGFPPLDRLQTFYPGLYCLGAAPAQGKTAFALQLTDQAAAAGQYVLYFSLGQSQFELASRSLARGFLLKELAAGSSGGETDPLPAPSSLDVRQGVPSASHPQDLQAQIDHYAAGVGDRMNVIHGASAMTVEDIEAAITGEMAPLIGPARPGKPLVIVDHLQAIASTPVNGNVPDPKSAMDHAVPP